MTDNKGVQNNECKHILSHVSLHLFYRKLLSMCVLGNLFFFLDIMILINNMIID